MKPGRKIAISQAALDKLCELVQLDIDATEAYGQAIKYLKDATIARQLSLFQNDHKRHIASLNKVIEEYGGTPLEHKKDFKGFVIKAFTSIQSMTGDKMAMKAMQKNEELTNKVYHEALSVEFPTEEIRQLIGANYKDEVRHLKYINDTLKKQD